LFVQNVVSKLLHLFVLMCESFIITQDMNSFYTGRSKILCAPVDFSTGTTDDLKMAITEYIRNLDRVIICLFNLRNAAFKAYCAILVRRSNFRHQASPRVSPCESTQRRKVELWAINVQTFCQICRLKRYI
jgi:hypothetical protein